MFFKTFLFLICTSLLIAQNTTLQNNMQEKEQYILNSLDVNKNFLKDSIYIDMKKDISKKRNKYHLFISNKNREIAKEVLHVIKQDPLVPDTIFYLAMAESKFELNAKSELKASGIWQFMPKTAQKYNLTIDKYIDERYDMRKATTKALTYLKFLHRMFGKWYLAIIAYNCGEGALLNIIKKTKSDNLTDLLASKYLPNETKNHIRKIIAMAYINHGKFNSNKHLAKVKVDIGVSFYDISKWTDLNIKHIRYLNPQFKYDLLHPFKENFVYIPSDKLKLFKKNIITNQKYLNHHIVTVKDGDSLYAIAQKYNMDYHIIKDFNHLKNNIIHKNDTLLIPRSRKFVKYVVKRGDTLGEIAQMYNVKLDKLMKINKLRHLIKIGSELVIPIS